MLEDEVDPSWLLVVVLIFIDRGVATICVGIRGHCVSNANIAPAQTFSEFTMLLRKGDRTASEQVADISDVLQTELLFVLRCAKGDPCCACKRASYFRCLKNPGFVHGVAFEVLSAAGFRWGSLLRNCDLQRLIYAITQS